MSTPGKNAKKRAKRKAVVPNFNTEPDNLEPYPQPTRCSECGEWVAMMCMVGTGQCSLRCEEKAKERGSKGGKA